MKSRDAAAFDDYRNDASVVRVSFDDGSILRLHDIGVHEVKIGMLIDTGKEGRRAVCIRQIVSSHVRHFEAKRFVVRGLPQR